MKLRKPSGEVAERPATFQSDGKNGVIQVHDRGG